MRRCSSAPLLLWNFLVGVAAGIISFVFEHRIDCYGDLRVHVERGGVDPRKPTRMSINQCEETIQSNPFCPSPIHDAPFTSSVLMNQLPLPSPAVICDVRSRDRQLALGNAVTASDDISACSSSGTMVANELLPSSSQFGSCTLVRRENVATFLTVCTDAHLHPAVDQIARGCRHWVSFVMGGAHIFIARSCVGVI